MRIPGIYPGFLFIISYLHMYIIYLKGGKNDMFFYNILDEISDILIYYYSMARCVTPNRNVYDFLQYHLRNRIEKYSYKRDEIESIVVSFGTHHDLIIDSLNNISIYEIKQYISENIADTSIHVCKFRDFSISFNVCPFEGLTIDSSFVISVCDCMMY